MAANGFFLQMFKALTTATKDINILSSSLIQNTRGDWI